MPDREYSKYQKQVIRRYYDNRDAIDEQRLSELVANVYLSEGSKREKLWRSAESLMLRLNVPESRVTHVVNSGDPAVLAAVVADLQAGKIIRKKAGGK